MSDWVRRVAVAPGTVGVFLRGVAMGAADVVPGVSGGTVAFVSGIYERLLDAIKALDLRALRLLFSEGPRAFWRHIDGAFLLPLFMGILLSLFSLARVISTLLVTQPLLIWSLFLGLIAASSLHMLRQVARWNGAAWLALLLGGLLALAVAALKPAQMPAEPLFVFAAGFIAICAMILPGISGSFILVLLGMYGHVLTAIHRFDWLVLAVFAAGCASGLMVFSRLLSWLFHRFHNIALALLTGFLIGSLPMVWPWKQAVSFYQNSSGERLALEQVNLLPARYELLAGQSAQLGACLLMMVLGVALVLSLEWVAKLGSAKN